MLDFVFIAFFQAAAGDPQPAADPAPAAQTRMTPALSPSQAPPGPVHCRNMTPTGSHIPVRVCSSEAQDHAMSERIGDELRRRPPPAMPPEAIQAAHAQGH
ncbi:MAG: hypothetical protein ABUL55_01790 [Pseudomonadota bacterium]